MNKVTVFHITVGQKVFEKSLHALQNQTIQFEYEKIEFVSPMSAAFQCMIDRCKTPYYIQIDEDMILYPNAIHKMLEAIESLPENVAMIAFPLHDVHLDKDIMGVKIYRHAANKMAAYQNRMDCETEHLKNLQELGYVYKCRWKSVMGLHGVGYSKKEAFERYRSLAERSLWDDKVNWIKDHFPIFLRRLGIEEDRWHSPDLWAALGMTAGLTSKSISYEAKDFRQYPTMADFGELEAALVPAGPKTMNVYCSERCNLKCSFCARQNGSSLGNLTEESLLATHIEKTLAAFPTIKSVCFAGFGEPLLLSQADLASALAAANGRFRSLITNGLLLDHVQLMLSGGLINQLTVSLNAPTSAVYHERTGCNEFNRVVANIRQAAQIMPVLVSFVLGQDELFADGWVESCLELVAGIPNTIGVFVNTLPHGQPEDMLLNTIIQKNQETDDRLASLKETAKELGARVFYWPIPVDLRLNPRRCRSPFESIGVDSRGFFTGCSRCYGPSNLWGPWKGGPPTAAFQTFRRALTGAVKELPERCRYCFGNWA